MRCRGAARSPRAARMYAAGSSGDLARIGVGRRRAASPSRRSRAAAAAHEDGRLRGARAHSGKLMRIARATRRSRVLYSSCRYTWRAVRSGTGSARESWGPGGRAGAHSGRKRAFRRPAARERRAGRACARPQGATLSRVLLLLLLPGCNVIFSPCRNFLGARRAAHCAVRRSLAFFPLLLFSLLRVGGAAVGDYL